MASDKFLFDYISLKILHLNEVFFDFLFLLSPYLIKVCNINSFIIFLMTNGNKLNNSVTGTTIFLFMNS